MTTRRARPPPLQAPTCRVDGWQLSTMADLTDDRVTTATSTTTTAASICLQGGWAVAIDNGRHDRHDRHDTDRQQIAGRRRQARPPPLQASACRVDGQ
ncbi:hypothetical protein K443DRAFT_465755 [Laccaria amethystina LaAM-08-1]|uniref:Uncharacterized protein n=1 Tax=Laccaria amethystina LaAM-08-1 TaxID=1095629 RepID=A0A0C9Y6P0_9AGAR|nr:hypothetical protein K443DRAFT_465755 [Laccaria amethystina LaAM-08-1]